MQLIHNETESMLADSARKFFTTSSPLSRVRALRDAGDATGFSRELWAQMAELGWTGLLLPEEHEGMAMGLSALCVILEQAGRALAPEPFLSTVLLSAPLLARAGSPAQQRRWLPAIAGGEAIVALAHHERESRHARHRVATTATPTDAGFRITGRKDQVLDGHVADALIVSARSPQDPDQLSLFLVDPGAPGVTVTRQRRIDERNIAIVALEDVALTRDALVGDADRAVELLDPVLDRATIGLCAEMLGSMTRAFEETVAYLKERKQFGVAIGTFQALKHRAARLYMELTLARSVVVAAARVADDARADDARVAAMASLCKARCSDTFIHVANEGVQMFGGVGMTDEYDIGMFLKRARVAEQTLGDASWHRDRWARLAGY